MIREKRGRQSSVQASAAPSRRHLRVAPANWPGAPSSSLSAGEGASATSSRGRRDAVVLQLSCSSTTLCRPPRERVVVTPASPFSLLFPVISCRSCHSFFSAHAHYPAAAADLVRHLSFFPLGFVCSFRPCFIHHRPPTYLNLWALGPLHAQK